MVGSADENIAKYKAGWKGGKWFSGPLKPLTQTFVSGYSEANKTVRGEKDYPRIPIVLGVGSK